jgi:hypothetical protein
VITLKSVYRNAQNQLQNPPKELPLKATVTFISRSDGKPGIHSPLHQGFCEPKQQRMVPFSMTGTELLARLRQWLVDASNCTDGMNATTKVYFDEIEELCKERELNIRIFHNKNEENEDGEIHHMVQNWMREHLPTLKKKINGRSTKADLDTLNRLFEVFNTVIFGGALPARLCSWRFHRKGSKEWEENQKGRQYLGAANDYRFPGMGTRADGALASFDLYELSKEEDETPRSSVKRLLEYLGIMVHEMVHCLVFVYVCGCDECRARLDNPDGTPGHAVTRTKMGRDVSRDRGLCSEDAQY